jgi:hypothetical protein
MQFKGYDLYTNSDRQVTRYGEFQNNITEIFNITNNSSGSYIYIKLIRITDRIYSVISINQDNSEIQVNSNDFNFIEGAFHAKIHN